MCLKKIFNRTHCRSLPILAALILAWTFVTAVWAQESLDSNSNKNFLWSVETGSKTVYLLGSLHLTRSDAWPLAQEIESAYNDCKKVVFEADVGGMNGPAAQAKVMTLGLYPEGQTLEQNISGETYRLLQKKATALGLPMVYLARFKPWLCALTLTAMEYQRLGFDLKHGIDDYFLKKAKGDGKETIFLETVEHQLNLFTQLDVCEQESFLGQTLKDLEVMETLASDVVAAWKTGNVDKLSSIITISFQEYPDIYDRVFVQRNKEWAAQIDHLTKQNGNVLVIVGAGHLVGTEGLVELLKKKGYTVEQR